MVILHTSDLHIGKRLMDRDRLAEQRDALSEIVEICNACGVEVVLIAGDVFDTYTPSSEAESLFYEFVKRLSEGGRVVVVISGNHDDGVRLQAAAPLAEEHGVYIFGNKPRVYHGNRPVRIVKSGEYYLLLQNQKGEKLYVNALPYPNEARFKEDKTDESYSEKITRWIARGEEGYEGSPHVLLSHLFVAGGKTSESERDIDLGGARAVPLSVLPQEGYIALGHLHKRQKMGNCCYSGSILQYSFDEASTQKSVELLTTKGNGFLSETIALTAGKQLVRLQANGVEAALELLERYENAYIELTLILSEPLTQEQTQLLREKNEGLVSLIVKLNAVSSQPVTARANLSYGELFDEYYKSQFNELPKDELKEAFLSLMEEEE